MLGFQLILTLLIIVAIIRFTFVKIGAWWLRRLLIALLFTMLFRRVDAIGNLFGVDAIPPTLETVLSCAALILIIGAFESAHIRRRYLERAEAQRQIEMYKEFAPAIAKLEADRRDAERGMSWDSPHYRIRVL